LAFAISILIYVTLLAIGFISSNKQKDHLTDEEKENFKIKKQMSGIILLGTYCVGMLLVVISILTGVSVKDNVTGDINNWATLVIEIGLGATVAFVIFIYQQSGQKKTEKINKNLEKIITESEILRQRKILKNLNKFEQAIANIERFIENFQLIVENNSQIEMIAKIIRDQKCEKSEATMPIVYLPDTKFSSIIFSSMYVENLNELCNDLSNDLPSNITREFDDFMNHVHKLLIYRNGVPLIFILHLETSLKMPETLKMMHKSIQILKPKIKVFISELKSSDLMLSKTPLKTD
jgi:hypothetical protein